eukprot:gene17246-biopygen6216
MNSASEAFHLNTDASQSALGYVLGQVIHGKKHVIAYGGRELSSAEKRYSTTERKALAVVNGIKRPGRLNGNADALSRRLYDAPLSSVEQGCMLSVPVAVLVPPCPPAESLNFLQRQDKDLAMIIANLETSQLPSSDTQACNLLLTIDLYYHDERGLLCNWWTPGKRHVHSLVSQ